MSATTFGTTTLGIMVLFSRLSLRLTVLRVVILARRFDRFAECRGATNVTIIRKAF
jgi:hypothetical protein